MEVWVRDERLECVGGVGLGLRGGVEERTRSVERGGGEEKGGGEAGGEKDPEEVQGAALLLRMCAVCSCPRAWKRVHVACIMCALPTSGGEGRVSGGSCPLPCACVCGCVDSAHVMHM